MSLLATVGPPLVVAVLAANPVGEVRLAVPVAMLHFGMGWAEAFTWALAGNLFVWPLGRMVYPRLEAVARKSRGVATRLDGLFARVRHDTDRRRERLKELALPFIIAVPLPLSGAWTAALAAHVMDLERPLPLFYAGVVMATFVAVLLVSVGAWAFPFFYSP